MTNFGANFPNGRATLSCPFCEDETTLDSEEHMFNCEKMIILIPDIVNKKFMNIYSNNINIMNDGMQVMTEILNMSKQVLE